MRTTGLIVIAAIGITACGASALAQSKKKAPAAAAPAVVQQVIPPKTEYWLSVTTQNGFSMGGKPPSTGDMMRMAMGGGGQAQKILQLDLGSKLPPAGPPAARHDIPAGMDMGAMLPLKTPKPVVSKSSPTTSRPEHEDFERPKGKILLFWGCGETAGPNQPVVIDFSKMAAGEMPPNLFSGERIRTARPPSEGTWPTWGGWPNDDRSAKQSVPSDASLIGAHKVSGNYTPDINFTLDQDWMPALDMAQNKLPSGALELSWNAIPRATGHFAQLMGGSSDRSSGAATLVFWSSSEVQTFFSGLSDFIAPAEAARLVSHRYLMPPSQLKCSVPKEVMAATQGGMISLVAHGPEQNFVYPARPQDPKTPWVQEWLVKARYVARTGGMAGMDMSQGRRNAGRNGKDGEGATGKDATPRCNPRAPSGASLLGSAVGGQIGGALGGMFGPKPKPDDCKN